jgi:S-adenosylmethionine hydrolase
MDRKRNIIVLLTDFGNDTPYPGVMKGIIKSINPSVEIIDLTHNISPFSIEEGMFVLWRNYKYFPKGTIFVCVVDPGVGSKRKILLITTKNYLFLTPDNGIISGVLWDNAEVIKSIISIENKKYFIFPTSRTFHGRDIFAPVAAYLSLGAKSRDFGHEIEFYRIKRLLYPVIKKCNNTFIGRVMHIDRFGNIVTSFANEKFYKLMENKEFYILIKNKKIANLKNTYSEAVAGIPTLIWNSFDCLEIFIKEGNAAKVLHVNLGHEVILKT